MNLKILIVDDEEVLRKALKMTLDEKYFIIMAKNGHEALDIFDRQKPDLVLLDIGLPDISGIDVLKKIKSKDDSATVIMITAVDEVKTIVEAVRLGAYDYLVKPIDSHELLLSIKNAFENKRLKEQIHVIQRQTIGKYNSNLIGKSSKTKEMNEIARKASKSVDTPVLIIGESGSGKGALAKFIHYSSQKIPGPFVRVNCGAIAKDLVESELFGYARGAFTGAVTEGRKGRFEESEGGTLFLDEIGAMPFSAQAKLLGVLEDRVFHKVGGIKEIAVTSRIIAATNIDIEKAVAEESFRSDLFYRLNVVTIKAPPLRERPDDIMPLTEHFIKQYNSKFGKKFVNISFEAKSAILKYRWLGNIRELRNNLERIILLEDGNTILLEHFHFNPNLLEQKKKDAESDFSHDNLDYEEANKSLINKALKQTQGNVLEASRLLNLPVHKLRYRIKKLELKFK